MNPFLTTLLIALITLSEVKCEYEPPQFLDKGGDVLVKEGENIKLECNVKNLGEHVRLWKFNRTQVLFAGNLRIHRDDKYQHKYTSGALILGDFREEYSGIYTCQVSTNPPLILDYKVKLVKPPKIINGLPEQIIVNEMDTIRYDCKFWGTDTIEWLKDGQPIPLNQSLLVFEKAKPNDSGIYKCIVSNQYGKDEREVNITVLALG